MTTLSPSTMREDTSVNFTISDSENGQNLYYSFALSGNRYGQLTSFNGLTKSFTFKSDSGINFGGKGTFVEQSIAYVIYDDYPILNKNNIISENNSITFKILNTDDLPDQFITLVNNNNTNIVFNDSVGTSITSPSQYDIIKADISGIIDNDLKNPDDDSQNGQLPTNGTYKWYKSSTDTSGLYDGILFQEITGASGSTYTVTQDDVNLSIYVSYTYIGFGNSTINTAISGKTKFIQNFPDEPTGDFYITETELTSPINYEKFMIGSTLSHTNTISDFDVGGLVKINSSISSTIYWYSDRTISSPITSGITVDNISVTNSIASEPTISTIVISNKVITSVTVTASGSNYTIGDKIKVKVDGILLIHSYTIVQSDINGGVFNAGTLNGILNSVSANNIISYTLSSNDLGNNVRINYQYTDDFSFITNIPLSTSSTVFNGKSIQTPTIINKIPTQNVTIDSQFSYQLSDVPIKDNDGITILQITMTNNPSWLSISSSADIYTLSGTPEKEIDVGPKTITLQFTNSSVVKYTYSFVINVNPKTDPSSLIKIVGTKSILNSNGLRTIVEDQVDLASTIGLTTATYTNRASVFNAGNLNGTMPANNSTPIANGTYTSTITIASNGTGTDASISQIVIGSGAVSSITMIAGGSNYTIGEKLTISINGTALGEYTVVSNDLESNSLIKTITQTGSGVGGKVRTIILSNGIITSITMQGDGSNYAIGNKIKIQINQNNAYVDLLTYTLVNNDIISSTSSFGEPSLNMNGGFSAPYVILLADQLTNPNNIADGTYNAAASSTFSVTGGSGTGATVDQIEITSSLADVTMNVSGSGYLPGDILTISINSVELGPYTLYGTLYGTKTNSNFITHGPFQSGRTFVSQIYVSDKTVKYNSTNDNYESNSLKLTLPIRFSSWLTVSLNVSKTVSENNSITGFSSSFISGDIVNGFIITTSTAPNTDNTPYYWVFDITGNPTTSDIRIHTIEATITDNDSSTPRSFSFNFKAEIQQFKYFIPDNITAPVQGTFFEKFLFVTSTKGQNNISMVILNKPIWMKISLISVLNDQDIPTGVILMESIDESTPNVCNPVGPFNITIELRDGTGLTIQFSNSVISDDKKIGGYTENDFQWMNLGSPDQQLVAPRASSMPCYVCSGSNDTCDDPSMSNKYTKFTLDMRRKAETLQHKKQTFGYTKAQIISQFARSKQGKKKQWASQSLTESFPNSNNYVLNGFTLSCPNLQAHRPVFNASQSDVPGNKSFSLYLDKTVPVVGYVPVRRTYAGSGEKYPQSTYKDGDLGFPVGKSGRTPSANSFTTITFSVSGITISNIQNKFVAIENMLKLLFLGKTTTTELKLDSIVQTQSSSNLYFINSSNSGYTFKISIFKQMDNFNNIVDTIFDNQIITIFNKLYFFSDSSSDYRNMCVKILNISTARTDTRKTITTNNDISTFNATLQTICSNNETYINSL